MCSVLLDVCGFIRLSFTLCSAPHISFILYCCKQGEMESQKQQHDAKLISTKEDEKLKMDKMALELELKWTETLR